ncbi:unnamed protein product, partial [Darwinula stevensoni]
LLNWYTMRTFPKLVGGLSDFFRSPLSNTRKSQWCQWKRAMHQVELTSVRYPNVKRGPYATVDDNDIKFFERVMEPSRVMTDPDIVDSHNVDWLKMVRGASQVLLRPKSTKEVSEVLKYCNTRRLAVCPQGGKTGLVGGGVPVFDEIIISTSLMDDIIAIDGISGALTCEAGCILEDLDNYAAGHGFMMPLDLGAKGSCHIGGNVSTNAGGIRLIRYGNLHHNVLGVEAVLANGEVVDGLTTIRKDNSGYDISHLFIGSEGTLGFVSKVAIECVKRPKAVNVAYLGLKNFNNVLATFRLARESLGEILSSCEFMDAESVHCVEQNLHLRLPIPKCPFYMLIETNGSNATHDEDKLMTFLDLLMRKKLVIEGTMASEPRHISNLWQTRERITEALLLDGYTYKYDISLPLTYFYQIVEEMRNRVGKYTIRCCGYGHLGDGNLHLNMTSKEFNEQLVHKIEPYLFEYIARKKGSVSAEHGLGFKKRDFIHYSKSPSAIELMRRLKNAFDPNGILNPYKVLPDLPYLFFHQLQVNLQSRQRHPKLLLEAYRRAWSGSSNGIALLQPRGEAIAVNTALEVAPKPEVRWVEVRWGPLPSNIRHDHRGDLPHRHSPEPPKVGEKVEKELQDLEPEVIERIPLVPSRGPIVSGPGPGLGLGLGLGPGLGLGLGLEVAAADLVGGTRQGEVELNGGTAGARRWDAMAGGDSRLDFVASARDHAAHQG